MYNIVSYMLGTLVLTFMISSVVRVTLCIIQTCETVVLVQCWIERHH